VTEDEGAAPPTFNKYEMYTMAQQRAQLPIAKHSTLSSSSSMLSR